MSDFVGFCSYRENSMKKYWRFKVSKCFENFKEFLPACCLNHHTHSDSGIHERLYVSKLKEERLCWVSHRHREGRGCKYSWPSCQRAVPLCWLLSLHWSLIHDIHVQWPPRLTSIMGEDVPFLPPAWCQFLQETGACWSPYILGFLYPLHHYMHIAGCETFWRSFLRTLHFFSLWCSESLCSQGLKCKFLMSLFPEICLCLATNLREVNVWTSLSAQKCKSWWPRK